MDMQLSVESFLAEKNYQESNDLCEQLAEAEKRPAQAQSMPPAETQHVSCMNLSKLSLIEFTLPFFEYSDMRFSKPYMYGMHMCMYDCVCVCACGWVGDQRMPINT